MNVARVLAFHVCCVLAAVPTSADQYALIISGASGGAEHAERFDKWRSSLTRVLRERMKIPDERLTVLGEKAATGVGLANGAAVRQAFDSYSAKLTATDNLLIVLIGHGTTDGTEAKFNLVGPDIESAEWADLLKTLKARLAIVNTTAASFPFLARLSAPGRVVMTATDSAAQRYQTVFPEYFIAAFEDPSSDLDKNNRVSLLEIFMQSSAQVKQYYEKRGQLSTERPLLDDNGDGVGKQAGAPGADGAIAARVFLDSQAAPSATADQALAALIRRRLALEGQIEELKGRKTAMDPAEYDKALEALAIELAKVSREIREKS